MTHEFNYWLKQKFRELDSSSRVKTVAKSSLLFPFKKFKINNSYNIFGSHAS